MKLNYLPKNRAVLRFCRVSKIFFHARSNADETFNMLGLKVYGLVSTSTLAANGNIIFCSTVTRSLVESVAMVALMVKISINFFVNEELEKHLTIICVIYIITNHSNTFTHKIFILPPIFLKNVFCLLNYITVAYLLT